MEIQHHVSLKHYNTFGLDITASELATIEHENDISILSEVPDFSTQSLLVLGGGSNVLFSGDYAGLVLKNNILGKEVLKQNEEFVWVRLGAGENWHQVVLWSIENGWGGIENLSLIPGTVGAAPMQNIGAYGVELSSVFEYLEAFELKTGKIAQFNTTDCDFGYRYSVFKGPLKQQFIITRVILKLSKHPTFNTSYGAVAQTLEEMGVEQLTIKDISSAVIKIRQSKLPDPAVIGNAGSFFKNPIVANETLNNLKTEYTNIPSYAFDNSYSKIPAGWLIEQCQWKGYRKGSIGVHAKQALVLVNYGGAKGRELVDLSKQIQASVQSRFGIELIPEVNIV